MESEIPTQRAAGGCHPAACSLPEVHGSIAVPETRGFWRKLFAFAGPGYLVAVGYMDPGNWATDLAGGARYGYTLLSVIMMSNLMAILLQALVRAAGHRQRPRPGAGVPRQLLEAGRRSSLWVLCEIAIAACDLAEVIGAAIALNLLFGLPLIWGVCLTALDVLIVLFLQHQGFRYVEALVVALIVLIAGSFAVELWLARPDWRPSPSGSSRGPRSCSNPNMLYIAIGILGATVMPHNLYLHSSIVQTRKYGDTPASKGEAIRFASIDSAVALMFALFINARDPDHGGGGVPRQRATRTSPTSATPTSCSRRCSARRWRACCSRWRCSARARTRRSPGTLAGQIVMEGFINLRIRPWLRRLITRLIAIIPAVIVIVLYGERGTGPLLILSQVILSLQLPFAVFPLVMFTSDPHKMGPFVNPLWVKALAWTGRGYHRRAERLPAVSDVRGLS